MSLKDCMHNFGTCKCFRGEDELRERAEQAERDRDGYNQLQGEYREKYAMAEAALAEAQANEGQLWERLQHTRRELAEARELLERSLAMMEATYEYDNDAVSEKMGVVMADVRTYLAYGQSARVSEPSCGCVFCDIDASHSTEECTRADQGAP